MNLLLTFTHKMKKFPPCFVGLKKLIKSLYTLSLKRCKLALHTIVIQNPGSTSKNSYSSVRPSKLSYNIIKGNAYWRHNNKQYFFVKSRISSDLKNIFANCCMRNSPESWTHFSPSLENSLSHWQCHKIFDPRVFMI